MSSCIDTESSDDGNGGRPRFGGTMEVEKVAVILTTYRQPEVLLLTLRDLSVQDYPADAWEVVVIDDGSRDRSAEIAMMSLPNDVSVTVKRLAHGGTYSHAKLFNEMI